MADLCADGELSMKCRVNCRRDKAAVDCAVSSKSRSGSTPVTRERADSRAVAVRRRISRTALQPLASEGSDGRDYPTAITGRRGGGRRLVRASPRSRSVRSAVRPPLRSRPSPVAVVVRGSTCRVAERSRLLDIELGTLAGLRVELELDVHRPPIGPIGVGESKELTDAS